MSARNVPRRPLATALRCLALLAAFFLAGEALLRVQGFGLAGLSYDEMSTVKRVLMSEFGIEPVKRTLATVGSWGLMPNTRGFNKGERFEVNNFGLRGEDTTLAKPPGTFRIAVIGGSLTMGAGIPLAHTWPYALQTKLDATLPDRHFEVLNLGVPNTRRCLGRNIERALYFSPDLILWQIGKVGPEEQFRQNYRMARWYANDHHVPLLAFSLDVDRYAPEPRAKGYFELLPPLGIEYGPEHYLYPSDDHPDDSIHLEYAAAVHDLLVARLPRLAKLLAAAPQRYESKYKPPVPRPWVDPDPGFWECYVWKRLSRSLTNTGRELAQLRHPFSHQLDTNAEAH